MGVTFNGSRGGRKTPQEIAKLATEAHNKKRVVITSAEPIEFLKIPTKEVDKESSVNVADLVDAVKDSVVEGNEFNPSELDNLTKAELIAYATAAGVEVTEKLKSDILKEIVLALS